MCGFIDITHRDVNTHNQLLYDLAHLFNIKEELSIGGEWIFYEYKNQDKEYKTSLLQAMLKYKF
jgi:hypothetical protein